MAKANCGQCGMEVNDSLPVCPNCGSTWKTYPCSIIQEGKDRVWVSAPGAKSEMFASADGGVTGTVEGVEAGDDNEASVAHTLQGKLRQLGYQACVEAGDNARGVDRFMCINDQRLALQITTAPDRSVWKRARAGTATVEFSREDALDQLRKAVERKVQKIPPRQRGDVILVIDSQHLGTLNSEATAQAYGERFGDPQSHGFASVWIVGATENACIRIGTGFP